MALLRLSPLLLAFGCVVTISSMSDAMMVGGLGETKTANAEIQSIIETPSVRSAAESANGGSFDIYQAVSYKTQLVAGTNYFIKVRVGNDEFIHMRVFKPLPYTGDDPSLSATQLNKAEGDTIAYFP